uniref:Transmembrane protein n=1 Tax=Syphacia muris TaxID=451379 RepID=A0A0N5AIE4_9BILA
MIELDTKMMFKTKWRKRNKRGGAEKEIEEWEEFMAISLIMTVALSKARTVLPLLFNPFR